MFTLESLKDSIQNLKVVTKEVPQTHLDQIISAMEKENLSQALPLIKQSFEQNLFDIRLIVYYLYIHFRDHGVKSFQEIFSLIHLFLNKHFEIIQPLNKREKRVETSLNWLFSHLVKKIKFFNKNPKEHPIWSLSLNKTNMKDLSTLLSSAAELKEILSQKLLGSEEPFLHLIKEIKELKYLVVAEEESEDIPVEATEPPVEEVPPAAFEEILQPPISGFESEKMVQLQEKLTLFSVLIEKGDYLKAALVAKDINFQIENFNPVLYFPKIFSQYFGLAAQHISYLYEPMQQEKTPQWELLEKLYISDLQAFTDLKLSS